MKEFAEKENACRSIFQSIGQCLHLWTPENFEIIFRTEDDFKVGMNILGICAILFPDIIILTFELMSNHIHICAICSKERLDAFFELFKKLLSRHCSSRGYIIDWDNFEKYSRILKTLDDVRNVIIYDNRNGYLVHPEHNPFSYPWGANKYFFNPDCCKYARGNAKMITLRECRLFSHSRIADGVKGRILMAEGYALPLSFCRIDIAEKLFRDSSQYFYLLGKNMESNREISKEIGESIFYTDNELYSIVNKLCKDKFGVQNPSTIPPDAKLELARVMRYDYNSSDKQIQRILRLDSRIIAAI